MANKKSIWRTTRVAGLFFREIVGWCLVLVSLTIFWRCFQFLNRAYVIEGFVAAIVGVMLFRGGLQLVKVAVAARALRPPGPLPSADQ